MGGGHPRLGPAVTREEFVDVGAACRQWPDRIRVEVNIPVNLNSWGLGRFTANTTVTQACTLRREVVDHSLIVID